MTNFDTIIIGGGAIGAFSQFNLAKRGMTNTLLIEQESKPGRGATGSWGSLIRAMHMNPVTTQKATASVSFYQHFEEIVHESCLYNRCGSLYFVKDHQRADITPHVSFLTAANISHRFVNAHEGRKEFPHFNWFDDDIAIFEENAGTACPHATTEALINNARQKGAEALFHDAVARISVGADKIFSVTTKSGTIFKSKYLVIAAGRWSKDLALLLGVDLPIHEKIIQINRFCRHHFHAAIPLFIDRNFATFGHFFPDGSFAGGYLLQSHYHEPFGAKTRLSIHDATIAKMHISKRLNWLKNSSLEGGIRAMESYSPDGQGIINHPCGIDNLIISAGFSCTGFTLAPYAGGAIADALLA